MLGIRNEFSDIRRKFFKPNLTFHTVSNGFKPQLIDNAFYKKSIGFFKKAQN